MGLSRKQKDELDSLAEQNNGILDAHQIVEFAKDERTALHKAFEWDTEKAAYKYWVEQARLIVRCYVVDVPTDYRPVKTRAYISLPSERGEQKFKRLKDVLEKRTWRDDMMDMAKSELEAVKNKYEILSELKTVWDAIEDIGNKKNRPTNIPGKYVKEDSNGRRGAASKCPVVPG